MLRQQEVIADDKPNRSLADFVAPIESGILDYIGAFAVTAGHGVDELVRRFEAERDDYSAIIVKALADRLAEAFAEYLHAQARRDFGYGAGEQLSNDELIAEHTGQSLEKVGKDTDRDFILTAEEAKEYGVVDDILHARGITAELAAASG